MARYVDGFIAPIPNKSVQGYCDSGTSWRITHNRHREEPR
jgi:hypothetical protein